MEAGSDNDPRLLDREDSGIAGVQEDAVNTRHQGQMNARMDLMLGSIGMSFVAFAMGAQAFFGVLLVNIIYRKKLSLRDQSIACAFTYVPIFLSKYCLVAEHSANDFKKPGHRSWWRSWNPWYWDSHASVVSELTFAVSSALIAYGGIVAFVGITGISLDDETGAANLLKSYNTTGADNAADVIGSFDFQWASMFMALVVNLFFFPNMNKLAWRHSKWALLWLFETEQYRTVRNTILNAIEWHRNELKGLYNGNNDHDVIEDKIKQLDVFLEQVGQVGTDEEKEGDKGSIKAFLSEHDRHSISDGGGDEECRSLISRPDVSSVNYVQRVLSVVSIAVGSIGFVNLHGLAPLLVAKIADIFFKGSETFAGETNAQCSGWLAVLALSSTCIAMVPPVPDEFYRATSYAGTKSFIRVSHPMRPFVDFFIAMVICAWGATPNTYQAVLNQQRSGGDNAFIAFAAMGSILIEFYAAYKFVQSCHFNFTKQDKEVVSIDNELVSMQRDYDKVDKVVRCFSSDINHTSMDYLMQGASSLWGRARAVVAGTATTSPCFEY